MPGFGLSMGFTLLYLSLIVLIPLSAVFVKSATGGWANFWEAATSERALDAYRVSFGAAAIAAAVNSVFGLLVAWVLVRYDFPMKRLVNAAVDLPFALPTAVAGIALTAIYADTGWVGQPLAPFGIKIAYHFEGIVAALVFIGLPFVVRTVEPVLAQMGKEQEEVAATLGATRLQIFSRVVLPTIAPTLATGASLAFARGVGEYGSVIFIAGNMPYHTEIAPLLIITELEQFDYAGATSIAAVMLIVSFAMLLLLNGLQSWQRSRVTI